jgi:hemerythrin
MMGLAARQNNYIIEELHEHIDKLLLHLRRVDGEVADGEESQYIEYAIEDFANSVMQRLEKEEVVLKTRHSPELVALMAQHRFFASQVNLLKIAFHAGQLTLAKSVVTFMRTWLDYHIFQEEPSYMAFVSNMLSKNLLPGIRMNPP